MQENIIFSLISQYGMFAIFVIIMLEYACFPLSSEVVLPFSGIVAAQLGHKVTVVITVSLIAGVLGSTFCYILGKIGGNTLMNAMLKKFPKAAAKFKKTCEWQQRYGKVSVMLARVIPIFRTYISFAAGITNQNYLVFIVFSSIGILSWNTILISCGYFLGEHFDVIAPYFSDYSKIIMIILLLFVILFIVRKILKSKKENVA